MNRILFTTTAAALAAGALAVSAAGASAQVEQPNPQLPSGAAAATTTEAIRCDGGRNINMRSRIVDSPFVFGETAVNAQDQAVPGAQLLVNGPASGTDTLLVTFSAETQLTGGETFDWIGLEVHRNGVPIEPFTAVGDVVAIASEPSWNGNSLQFCTKVGAGSHLIKVFANLQDNGADDSLSGWLDDYLMSVVRYD